MKNYIIYILAALNFFPSKAMDLTKGDEKKTISYPKNYSVEEIFTQSNFDIDKNSHTFNAVENYLTKKKHNYIEEQATLIKRNGGKKDDTNDIDQKDSREEWTKDELQKFVIKAIEDNLKQKQEQDQTIQNQHHITKKKLKSSQCCNLFLGVIALGGSLAGLGGSIGTLVSAIIAGTVPCKK